MHLGRGLIPQQLFLAHLHQVHNVSLVRAGQLAPLHPSGRPLLPFEETHLKGQTCNTIDAAEGESEQQCNRQPSRLPGLQMQLSSASCFAMRVIETNSCATGDTLEPNHSVRDCQVVAPTASAAI